MGDALPLSGTHAGRGCGTVTFLFTDIEGSTRLWEQHPEAMRTALARHDALLRQAVEAHGGHVFKTVGDQFCAAFAAAPAALAAAVEAQQALRSDSVVGKEAGHPSWLPLRVRMALHTGVAEEREGDYFGPPLNRIARLLAAGHGGQILLSLAAAETTQSALPANATLRDLGEHRLRDLIQPERVFQFVHPELPTDFPPLRSLTAFAHNLPIQLTRFIGREREMAEVKRLLSTTRLLTLTGTGGCGKTRLVLQVAAELLEEFPDGVWLVELAALADPALVPQTVATTLGVREEPGRSVVNTLTDHFQLRSLLLVLDNCEHLIDACALLTEALLRACPTVKLLATSREPLRITGELAWRVPSLDAPDSGQLPPVERLMQYDAVRLFLERASFVQPSFAVTPQNAVAVAQVCQKLDGIPLAIELAAARVRLLSLEQIAARLDDRFRLLTGGSRTALPRQQTLQATIGWSYNLLSEKEQTLLRRLAVFAGGWVLGAAEAVCAGEEIADLEVLDLLGQLVDKSLVLAEEHGTEVRYRLLETIRQYGAEMLRGSAEEAVLRHRHLNYFVGLAERAELEFNGPEQKLWYERLERELDNVRAAIEWPLEQGEAEAGLRLAGALERFWTARGLLSEGREHLTRLLALEGAAARTRGRAKALETMGFLAWNQGDLVPARSVFEESIAIFRELGDREGIAHSLFGLGNVVGYEGDEGAARGFWEESLARAREAGVKRIIANSVGNLGDLALHQGDYAAARDLFEEGLALNRELGNKWAIALALSNLGMVTEHCRDYARAAGLYKEALVLAWAVGEKWVAAICLEGLAGVARALGQPERAARVFGAAEALRKAIGSVIQPNDQAAYERKVEALRAALGEPAFAAAWAEGRAMPFEQAMAMALEGLDPRVSSTAQSVPS